MWQLKNYNTNPPGNFSYEQKSGIHHIFRAQPVIEQLVKDVSSFRIANNLPRGSLAETLEDVDRQNCDRLGNNPAWCWNSEDTFDKTHSSHPFVKTFCATCGTVVESK
jgi:hypothetical protein